jgi:L-methionine (R)-S-oxide reductase
MPLQGKPACQEIKFGRGVCGTAASKKETVVVPDVLEFPGHIACDADSRSEIVVPIIFEGEVNPNCIWQQLSILCLTDSH